MKPAAGGKLLPPVRLDSSHDVSQFSCGKPALDDWLRNRARKSEGRSARTYVVCEDAVVVGYYAIAAGSVERRLLPSGMRREQGLPQPIPVAIIGRLARDERFRGKGLGEDLLRDAIRKILHASETVGVRAILVHAIDEDAARFWRRFGFLPSPLDGQILFLPIETVVKAL